MGKSYSPITQEGFEPSAHASLVIEFILILGMVEHLQWFQCGLSQGLLEMQLAILKIKVHSSMIRSCYLPRLIFFK